MILTGEEGVVLLLSGITTSSLGHLHVNRSWGCNPTAPPPSIPLCLSAFLHSAPDSRENQREAAGREKSSSLLPKTNFGRTSLGGFVYRPSAANRGFPLLAFADQNKKLLKSC
ncbi:hypothetical protein AMECASPLE_011467 [Ameca splendens]|uniref:Uncharacterized protein n=1 Tax=Ameca splendens TaxID=208324 RepID=A0ABV0YC64_9TELE